MVTSSQSILSLVLSTLNNHMDEIRKTYGISKLGIFGSVSRKEDSSDSDIDILIDFLPDRMKYRAFINLAEELEQLLGRPVDLVTFKGLSPYMRPHIEHEVIWVYG